MSATAAALLVLLAVVEATIGSEAHDRASYEAGYAAASNSSLVRDVMARPGMTSSALCDILVEHAIIADEPVSIVRSGFVSGCTRAVAETME